MTALASTCIAILSFPLYVDIIHIRQTNTQSNLAPSRANLFKTNWHREKTVTAPILLANTHSTMDLPALSIQVHFPTEILAMDSCHV